MISAIAIILGIGIMILIHEFGHFVAAKSLGIKVEAFSIGFGPAIFKIQGKETLYKISAIPLGGYIKMKGEDPEEDLEGTEDEFLSRKTHEKIMVAIAGPIFNVILALLVLPLVYSVFGQKEIIFPDYARVVEVRENSPAASAGFERGDIIKGIDGDKIEGPQQVATILQKSMGETLSFTVLRDTATVTLAGRAKKVEQMGFEYFDFGVSFAPEPIVGTISEKSQAYRAGLREGDRILGINGEKIIGFSDINKYIEDGDSIKMIVERGGERKNITYKPVLESGINRKGKIRKNYQLDFSPPTRTVTQPFFSGLWSSIKEIGRDFTLIFISC